MTVYVVVVEFFKREPWGIGEDYYTFVITPRVFMNELLAEDYINNKHYEEEESYKYNIQQPGTSLSCVFSEQSKLE